MNPRHRTLVPGAVLASLLAALPAAAFDPSLLFPARTGAEAVGVVEEKSVFEPVEAEAATAASRTVQAVVASSPFVARSGSLEYITGWDDVTPATAVGRAIEAVPRGFVLKQSGVYQIVIEGSLLYTLDDATSDPGSAAFFNVQVGGVRASSCVTVARSAGARLGPQALTQCTTSITVDVRGRGVSGSGSGTRLYRNSLVELSLLPNDLALGSETLGGVYVVITKLSDWRRAVGGTERIRQIQERAMMKLRSRRRSNRLWEALGDWGPVAPVAEPRGPAADLQNLVELVDPKLAATLDLRAPRFIDKEAFTNFPGGKLAVADLVAEAMTPDYGVRDF